MKEKVDRALHMWGHRAKQFESVFWVLEVRTRTTELMRWRKEADKTS